MKNLSTYQFGEYRAFPRMESLSPSNICGTPRFRSKLEAIVSGMDFRYIDGEIDISKNVRYNGINTYYYAVVIVPLLNGQFETVQESISVQDRYMVQDRLEASEVHDTGSEFQADRDGRLKGLYLTTDAATSEGNRRKYQGIGNRSRRSATDIDLWNETRRIMPDTDHYGQPSKKAGHSPAKAKSKAKKDRINKAKNKNHKTQGYNMRKR